VARFWNANSESVLSFHSLKINEIVDEMNIFF
jgi:hypothetical protein